MTGRHFSLAEKQDPRNYHRGMTIQTHQNFKGIPRQSAVRVIDIENDHLIVEDQKTTAHKLSFSKAKDFDVYEVQTISLGKGDRVRIVKNSIDTKGRKLSNGSVLTVTGFTKNGDVRLASQKTHYQISKSHGNYELAYCSTSYSAQGKTVDRVIIAQPSITFVASDKKQFYVSASRARESVVIYTDDKEELLNAVSKSLDDMPALELFKNSRLELLKL